MSDSVVGNCLHLYLQNYALIGSLENQEALPLELKEEEQVFLRFGERARDQAAGLLELLCSQVVMAGAIPYRVQRRSQRRTVREQWRMDGTFLRPREKMPRNFWSLYLGALRDKGPSACLVVGPADNDNTITIDVLATYSAGMLGLESAAARTAFSHDTDYHSGVILGFSSISPSTTHQTIAETIKEQLGQFFAKYRPQLEGALENA